MGEVEMLSFSEMDLTTKIGLILVILTVIIFVSYCTDRVLDGTFNKEI